MHHVFGAESKVLPPPIHLTYLERHGVKVVHILKKGQTNLIKYKDIT